MKYAKGKRKVFETRRHGGHREKEGKDCESEILISKPGRDLEIKQLVMSPAIFLSALRASVVNTFRETKMKTFSHQFDQFRHRSASALILVLVVIVMLTLGAYTFSELMITEYEASDAYARQVQSRLWAESGVDYVSLLLTPDGGGFDADLFDDPGLFHVPMGSGGGFSIVAPFEEATAASTDPNAQVSSVGLRYGLTDECAKMNVNVLANYNPLDDVGRNMLMELPYMTVEVADAILDWIDADEEVREYGAEAESYSLVFPRNGTIDSLEELMFVLGVEPQLMYGEDANRNGILDPNENDGEQSLPMDNADGILDLGWSAYLTTYSVEANYRHAYDRFSEERINVNEPLLTDLYDGLLEEYDEDIAQFVTAYRLSGPNEDLSDLDDLLGDTEGNENPLNGMGNSGAGTSGDFETDLALEDVANSIAKNLFSGSGGSITRAGMDLSSGASTEIRSIYDLIDAEVDVEVDGTMTTLISPWSSDPGELQETLPLLLDAFTVTKESVIRGRININQARIEVMEGIPGMPVGLPSSIVAARARNSGSSTTLDQYSTTGWLLIQGLVDLETMRSLDGFITAQGDVFRMQVVGHADRGGPVTRIEAVVDSTEAIPKVIFQRNLSELGPGDRSNQLIPFGE